MHEVCTDDLRTAICAFCKSATIVAELSLSGIQTAKQPGLGTLVDLTAVSSDKMAGVSSPKCYIKLG